AQKHSEIHKCLDKLGLFAFSSRTRESRSESVSHDKKGNTMKTNPIRLLAALIWLLLAFPAVAGQWLDLYWPLNDGDYKTFIYDGTNELTLRAHNFGGGKWQLCEDSPDASQCLNLRCDDTGCSLVSAEVGNITVSFDPPVLLLNETILQNGGTVKTVT